MNRDDMFDSISIIGFRGFSKYHISNLGRINLIVGKNNCGKTSILEAINILASGGDPNAILTSLERRGEFAYLDPRSTEREELCVDVSHLFYDHLLEPGKAITISDEHSRVRLSIGTDNDNAKRLPGLVEGRDDESNVLIVDGTEPEFAWSSKLIEGVGLRVRRTYSRMKDANQKKAISGSFRRD
jgi:predicted ATP-dependent endonuclease of OLD family